MTDDLNNVEESIATAAFRDALEVLHSLEISEPKTAPPFVLDRLSSGVRTSRRPKVSLGNPRSIGVTEGDSV